MSNNIGKLSIVQEDGDKESITHDRRAYVKKLLHSFRSYGEEKGLDVNSVALRFELGMLDGDDICAFNAISLGSNVQECTDAQSQELKDNNPCDKRILDIQTFDELAVRTTQSFEQAMTFLKASFHKANRLTEDAQNSREEIKIKYDSLNEVVNVAEKKVAEKDLLIVKLHRELQQANADICRLNKEQSRRDEELLKVKQELLIAREEILRKEVEYCTGKRAAVAESPPNELNNARPNEEDKKSTDGPTHVNIKVNGQAGGSVLFKIKRSIELKAFMEAYFEQKKKKSHDMCFIFNGRQIRAQQTPDELEMEDGDVIYVHETRPSLLISKWLSGRRYVTRA